MRTKEFIFCAATLLLPHELLAWGAEGHRIIGEAAFGLLDETARSEVLGLLGDPPADEIGDAMSRACNWPDTVRREDGWKWSSPLHYVNIPRHAQHYDRERDCPEGRCVSEGIVHFANQLAYPVADEEKRWQAFAFVCHLVADLHQPLHAGFRDDRGGNSVEIEFGGDSWNLHQFWDGVNVRRHLRDETTMIDHLVSHGRQCTLSDWNPVEVKAWTDESHALAAEKAYPDQEVIDEKFSLQSWEITVSQWEHAAKRLARVLNATLGEGDVLVEE